jgi:uncharacterized membrane protein YgaE (UPF0421/DUF939 family)
MSTLDNPLDWYDILVNEFAGSLDVFIILGLVAIVFLCAKFRMPNIVTIAVMIVFVLAMSKFKPTILYILLLIIGAFVSFMLEKVQGNK